MIKIKNTFDALVKLLMQIPAYVVSTISKVRNTPHERLFGIARAALMEFGSLGIVGIGIFIMCIVFYFSALSPGEDKLQVLREKADQLGKSGIKLGGSVDAGKDPSEQLAIFYRAFPTRKSVSAALEMIYVAASEEGLRLDQADYKASNMNSGKLTRYQVTMPIRGGYSNIHKFLVRVLREVPTASLEHVLFERKKINDAAVDATVTLVLHLGPEL